MWGDPLTAVKMTQPHLAPFLLPVECLDATILTAEPTEDAEGNPTNMGINASIAGDGFLVGRKRYGGYTLILSEYPSGAPRYPSYDLDPVRRARYVQEYGDVQGLDAQKNFVHRITIIEDGKITSVTDHPIEDVESKPYRCLFEALEYDMVLLLSDGAQSFHRPVGSNGATENVPYLEVIEEMLAVKGFAGEFIVRRARAFLKKAASKGWSHDDDFSVAAIYLGEIAS